MYLLHMYNSKHSSILLYAYSTDSTRKIISVHINNSKTTPLDTMDIHIVNIFSKQTVRATDFSWFNVSFFIEKSNIDTDMFPSSKLSQVSLIL